MGICSPICLAEFRFYLLYHETIIEKNVNSSLIFYDKEMRIVLINIISALKLVGYIIIFLRKIKCIFLHVHISLDASFRCNFTYFNFNDQLFLLMRGTIHMYIFLEKEIPRKNWKDLLTQLLQFSFWNITQNCRRTTIQSTSNSWLHKCSKLCCTRVTIEVYKWND